METIKTKSFGLAVYEKAPREFKAIYKEQYSKDITDEKALDLATNFLTIMNVIYRPVKKEMALGKKIKKQPK